MYNEYPPHPLLAPYIETYWASNTFAEERITQHILPDGCVDILFDLSNNTFTPCIVGTMNTFLEIEYLGKIKIIGIRFKPAAITAFTNVPIYEFTNQSVDILAFKSVLDKTFYEKIEDTHTIHDILLHIDEYLLQKLPSIFTPDKRISNAVSIIKQAKGNILIPQLSQKLCLSERQFERKFKSSIGISAKMFSRINKFNYTRHFLQQNPNQSLFETAIDCGYYDHSHLIKEFKSLSGSSPLNTQVQRQ